jgi:formyl-CoA transferase
LLANVASSVLLSGEPAERWGNAHPSIVPYETIDVADGRLMLAVGNDAQFRALCGVLSQPGWADDPRFATNPARVTHRETLLPMIRDRFARKPVAEWTVSLETAGVPAGPVRTVSEALASPESVEREMVVSVGGVPTLAPVPKLDKTPARATPAPGRVGEHTDALLAELLGYDASRIAELRESGAVA